MEQKNKKSTRQIMRSLHRDVGFFLIGLTLVYSISGILLIYRDSDFLKTETIIQKNLPKNLSTDDLGKELRIRNFKILKAESDIIFFENGTYNQLTGLANYTEKKYYPVIDKIVQLHKTSSNNILHWLSIIFGVGLLFLVLSSFWMFKLNTKMFRRGIYFASTGLVIAIIIIII